MTTESDLKKEITDLKKQLAKAQKTKVKKKPTASNLAYKAWYAKHGKSYGSVQLAMKAYWKEKKSA